MTSATDVRPCPIPTTIAPPAASRYALPSASQIVVPSARTATGGLGSSVRRKTRPAIARDCREPGCRDAPGAARGVGRGSARGAGRLDAALRNRVEVGLVEDDLAEVPERVRLGWLGRVLVVEAEERALAVADLEEAHDVALVGGMLPGRLAPVQPGDDALDDDGRLEVGRRAG